LPIGEKPFGSGSIQSDGSNLVVHIAKNSNSKKLFVTYYNNGIRQGPDLIFMDYKRGQEIAVEFSVSPDNVAKLYVEKRLIHESYVSPDIKNRLLMLAWGDEHNFETNFRDVTLECS
jgi:hypothetical protein